MPKRIGQARAREVAIRFTNNKSYIYGMVDKPAGMLLSGLWKVRGCLAKKAPYPGLASEHLADRLMKSGLLITGTVDDVKRQMEKLLEEILVWLFHWGLIPREEALNQLELFATKIMPEFGLTKALA